MLEQGKIVLKAVASYRIPMIIDIHSMWLLSFELQVKHCQATCSLINLYALPSVANILYAVTQKDTSAILFCYYMFPSKHTLNCVCNEASILIYFVVLCCYYTTIK